MLPGCINTSLCIMIDTWWIVLTYVISVNLWDKQGLWFPFQTMTLRTTHQRNEAHQLDKSLLLSWEGVGMLGKETIPLNLFPFVARNGNPLSFMETWATFLTTPAPRTTAMIDNIHWAFTMSQKLCLIFFSCIVLFIPYIYPVIILVVDWFQRSPQWV